MRKYKGAVIAIAVLAVLICAYFLVTNYLADRTEVQPEDSKEYISYYTAQAENVQSVKVVNETGEFTFEKDAEGNWYLPENSGIELVQTTVSSFVVSMSFFDGELIGEGLNYADYGLDDPDAVVTLTMTDGKTDTIYIGDITSSGDMCYVRINDNDTIYTAFAVKHDNAVEDVGYFRPNTFYTFDSSTLNSVNIIDDENGEINIVAKDPQKYDISIAGWQMTKPFYKEIYNTTLGDIMVNPLSSSVQIVEYISDNPTDLSQYGLEKPLERVKIDTDKEVAVLLFGRVEGGNVYAMKEGYSTVYLVPDEPFAFRNADPFNYVAKLVNVVNIADLNSLTISSGSDRYVIEIDGDKYTVNSVETEKTKITSFYETLMLLSVRGVLEEKPDAEPEYIFEYAKKDGTSSMVQLIPYKERFYAAWVDGVMDFYVNKADAEAVFDKLSALIK